MAFLSFLDPALDFAFGWILLLPPLLAILLMSLLISLIIVIIYKYTTNQDLMKRLKEETKALQKELKELKDQPEKAAHVQKRAMEVNMKYMMQSMKSTLWTFIPIILIFGWLNAHLAYEQIMPGEDFTVTLFFPKGTEGNVTITLPEQVKSLNGNTKTIIDSQATFGFKAEEGSHLIEFDYNDKTYTKDVLVTKERKYAEVDKLIKEDKTRIHVNNKPTKVMNLFGWKLGWIGSYIIFSIVFSMLLRKWMKVY